MSQALLFVAIHALGALFVLAFGPRRWPWLCAALAFPTGLAITVVAAIALLVTTLPYTPVALGGVLGALAAALAVAAVRARPDRAQVRAMVLWGAGFAAATAALTFWNLMITARDSYRLLQFSLVIVEDRGFDAVLSRMFEWGVFQVVAQTLAMLTPQDFLYGLPVVFGLSLAPVFALTLWHALAGRVPPRLRLATVVVTTLALFTIPMVMTHVLYLLTNFSSAVFLFGFVVVFWLAETEREPGLAPIALVSLTGFALQRTENPLIAVVFLALTVPQSELPRRAITPWLIAFVVIVGGWYEVLAQNIAPRGDFLNPMRCRILWGILVAALAWWLVSDRAWARRINRWLPAAVAAGGALILLLTFGTRFSHMWRSTGVVIDNLRDADYWVRSAYVIAAIALVSLAFPAPRFRQVFAIGIPVFLALAVALAYDGKGYRPGPTDSANRMILHVLPLIFWYLARKIAPALVEEEKT